MTNETYLRIPEEALDSAFRDLFKARTSTIEASKAQKKRTGKGFFCEKLKFQKRKDKSGSIEIRKRAINIVDGGIVIWPKFFGTKNKILKTKDDIPPLLSSCRLQKSNNKYYLCVPLHKEVLEAETEKTCAIDPGVRTMLTGYDPEGFIFELGLNIDVIAKRWVIADKLQAKLRNFKGKRNNRYSIKRERLNIFDKSKRMIKDCHHKISKWLATNYNKVLLPKFETQQMVSKLDRKIGRETARRLLGWSHYSFKELLRYKMNMNGNKLIDCTEEYTSMTCTCCGRLNRSLGASKVFKCPFKDCSIEIDRDIGAARNIYMKNFSLL